VLCESWYQLREQMVRRESNAALVGGQQWTEMVEERLNRVRKIGAVVVGDESRWKMMTEQVIDMTHGHRGAQFTQQRLRLSINTLSTVLLQLNALKPGFHYQS